MNYPSVKTIMKIPCIDKSQALEVRDILTGKVSPDEYCAEWIAQCYHRPALHELKLEAINRIIKGYGVEYVRGNGYRSPEFYYVNQGDTYALTVVFMKCRYIVASWGGIVERGNYE